ncbi:hypothetical protein ANN_17242 [Periplaneta americana]|uniref:Uncharacterized protein n=1 Tax=Periplaneta americana TaxID=6978 RepID=A0ABQ8STT6_PERAM|nr:hypothetical protein ANN_17242 [Periplaneta americana]
MFDGIDAASISNAQTLLGDPNIKKQCEYISSNFRFIHSTIECLEKIGVKLVEKISIVNHLISKVNDLQDDISKKLCVKMNTVIQKKNGGFNSLCKIARVLSDDKCGCYQLDVEMDDVKYFTYAPDVERSFSAYKQEPKPGKQQTRKVSLTMYEILEVMDEDTIGASSVIDITIFPPADGPVMDEESGGETTSDINYLSGRILRSTFEVNVTSANDVLIDNDEGNNPRPSIIDEITIAYRRNRGWRGGRPDADPGCGASGAVPQLALRAGAGQSSVEGGLQGHPDERGAAAAQRVAQHQNLQGNMSGVK